MNRRKFVSAASRLLMGAALTSQLPACASDAGSPNSTSPQSRFAGQSLDQLVRAKAHHGRNRFINPFGGLRKDFGRLLKWKLFTTNQFKQYYPDEKTYSVDIDFDSLNRNPGLSITFIKHACLLIQDNGVRLLIDPVFKDMFPLINDFSPLAFDPAAMPAPDHVLITHGHYDHLNEDSLKLFPPETHVITPLGYDTEFYHLEMLNRTKLDWLESWTHHGMTVVLLPSNHWTMRNPIVGPNRSLWGSYIIQTASGPTIYVSGDAAWFDHFNEIGEMFDIDLAVFNLGAYEPRWFMKASHMNPTEVGRAFTQLKARKLMVVHWGAYRLGDEPIHFPPRDMSREMARLGQADKLVHLDPGQTLFM